MKFAILSDTRLPTSKDFPGHGLGKSVLKIAEGLLERGHEVTLLAGYGSKFSGPTFYADDERKFTNYNFDGFDAILDSGHGHTLSKTHPELPVVNRSADRESFPGVSAVFPSERHAEFHRVVRPRIIYNGVDPTEYRFSKQGKYVAFFAADISHKGLNTAIQASKLAGVQLKVAGNYSYDGIGPLFGQERLNFITLASVLLYPSMIEAGPSTPIEFSMTGCPVVCLNRGGTPEYVKESVSGFIVDNVEEMAEKITLAQNLNRSKVRAWTMVNRNIHKMIDGYETALKDRAKGVIW